MPQSPHHRRGRQPGPTLPSLCLFPAPSVINTELFMGFIFYASNTAQRCLSPLLDHNPPRDAPARREVSSTHASRGGPDASSSLAFPPFPLALALDQAGKILQQTPAGAAGCRLSMATVHQGVSKEEFCPLLPSPGRPGTILIAFPGLQMWSPYLWEV